MGSLSEAAQKMRHETASKMVFPEKKDELSRYFAMASNTKYGAIAGQDMLQMACEMLEYMQLQPDTKKTASLLLFAQDRQELYKAICDFLFRFASKGPELIEALQSDGQSHNLKSKWEINLKKMENRILNGDVHGEDVRHKILMALSATQTPLSLKMAEHCVADADKWEMRMECDDRSTFIITMDKEQNLFLSVMGTDKSFRINERTVDLFTLAHITDHAMQSYLDSGKVAPTRLSVEQNQTMLETFIKIARKYEGYWREKELILTPDIQEKKRPPAPGLAIECER